MANYSSIGTGHFVMQYKQPCSNASDKNDKKLTCLTDGINYDHFGKFWGALNIFIIK